MHSVHWPRQAGVTAPIFSDASVSRDEVQDRGYVGGCGGKTVYEGRNASKKIPVVWDVEA